jgi:hypothetical protein
MKRIASLVFLAFSGFAAAGQADPWLRAPTANIGNAKIIEAVPRERVFEVPVSLLESAMQQLKDLPIVALQSYDLDSFSRWHFTCPAGSNPYLVRAVYENGGTGGYFLQRVDSSLWVTHSSLGAANGQHRSALLVCLGFHPSQVFVMTSGAL